MKYSLIKGGPLFRGFTSRYRLETGFSMLEAVVVVGVLLALAVGGFFAFGPITENAKRSAVKSAASEVHTGVLVASMDGDAETTPDKVIDGWNDRTNKISVAIISQTGEDYCISATDTGSPEVTAQSGDCSGGGGSATPPSNESAGETITTDEGITYTTLTQLNPENTEVDASLLAYMNTTLAGYASPEYLEYQRNNSLATMEAYNASPAMVEQQKLNTTVAASDIWGLQYKEMVLGDPEFNTLLQTYNNAKDAMEWGDESTRTIEGQQALVTAQRDLFEYYLTKPYKYSNFVAYAGNPDGYVTEVIVAAGSTTPINITVALPADAPEGDNPQVGYYISSKRGMTGGHGYTDPSLITDANGVRYIDYELIPTMGNSGGVTNGTWQAGETYWVGVEWQVGQTNYHSSTKVIAQ